MKEREIKRTMTMESMTQLYNKVKLILAVILLQFGYAGMSIISKFALNKGMSQHVLVVYRHAIATAVVAPFAIVLDRSPSPIFFLLFTCIYVKSFLHYSYKIDARHTLNFIT